MTSSRRCGPGGRGGRAAELAAGGIDGVVVDRVDGLRRATCATWPSPCASQPGVSGVVLGGRSDTGGAALVAAVTADAGRPAADVIKDAAKAVKGGGGGKGDVAIAGGKDPGGLDEALAIARRGPGLLDSAGDAAPAG